MDAWAIVRPRVRRASSDRAGATVTRERSRERHLSHIPMAGAERLLDETFRFVLGGVDGELCQELDWRAAKAGNGRVRRAAIYAAAVMRELGRIPLHHPDGIAQARFRVRVRYVERTAIPTLQFFIDWYPMSAMRHNAVDAALEEL